LPSTLRSIVNIQDQVGAIAYIYLGVRSSPRAIGTLALKRSLINRTQYYPHDPEFRKQAPSL